MYYELIRVIALGCIERMDALAIVGKTRDNAVLNYFTGAATGLIASGQQELGNAVAAEVGLVIAFRGYERVKELAR